jgi:hypothetical protein
MGASFGTSPGAVTVPTARPSHIYQPSYQSMGLGATPQASYFMPQMPTYSRFSTPQMRNPGLFFAPQQASYRVPFKQATPSTPAMELPSADAIRNQQLSYSQYQNMMERPSYYLPYAQSAMSGGPATFQPRSSIPYMTAAQQQAYGQRQAADLGRLLGPAPADPNASSGDGG